MTNTALEALRTVRALKKYACPQTPLAIQKILKNLNLPDLTSVVTALAADDSKGGQQ